MSQLWNDESSKEGQTFSRIDTSLKKEVHAQDNDVRRNVNRSYDHEHLRVFQGDLLRNLHHPEDDHQIGTDGGISVRCFIFLESKGQTTTHICGLIPDILADALDRLSRNACIVRRNAIEGKAMNQKVPIPRRRMFEGNTMCRNLLPSRSNNMERTESKNKKRTFRRI